MSHSDQRPSKNRFEIQNKSGDSVAFEIGGTFTRRDVQDLLAVPEAQRGGAWDTGYNPYQDQLYVFCNVGSAGRTGHDYENHWVGNELVWFGKTGTHVRQPLMRSIASGEMPVHIFWRANSARPEFIYQGPASVAAITDEVPVRIRWSFGAIATAGNIISPSAEKGALTLADVLGSDGRLFAKSEFGPANNGWPAVSFSSKKIAADFSKDFRRGKDFVLFVGTGDPNSTENPAHRRRVLSAVTFQPNSPISTNQIVPQKSWEEAVQKWGVRWEWSLPVTEVYELSPYAEAREIMPRTYSNLGQLASLGRCIPIESEDLPALLGLMVEKKVIEIGDTVHQIVSMNPSNPDVRKILSQLAISIQQRIESSGKVRGGVHPLRKGPNLSDIIATLNQKWVEQAGKCSLCDRPIPLTSSNLLFKVSPDRIDSDDKEYISDNLHLTHLGCNLAKNKVSVADWEEYLAMLRADIS